MGRQFFGSCLTGATCDCNDFASPRRVHAMCEQLQCCDRVFNQQQTISEFPEFRIALDSIDAGNRSNCTALKCSRDEPMPISELAVKTSADVVLLRQCKEQLARAHST